jgi:hypothetical protein
MYDIISIMYFYNFPFKDGSGKLTLRCQINESTRLAFLDFSRPPYSHFFHPTYLISKFPTPLVYLGLASPYSFIWAYLSMKFAQNIHPTRLFGPTRLIGTWEYHARSQSEPDLVLWP